MGKYIDFVICGVCLFYWSLSVVILLCYCFIGLVYIWLLIESMNFFDYVIFSFKDNIMFYNFF